MPDDLLELPPTEGRLATILARRSASLGLIELDDCAEELLAVPLVEGVFRAERELKLMNFRVGGP